MNNFNEQEFYIYIFTITTTSSLEHICCVINEWLLRLRRWYVEMLIRWDVEIYGAFAEIMKWNWNRNKSKDYNLTIILLVIDLWIEVDLKLWFYLAVVDTLVSTFIYLFAQLGLSNICTGHALPRSAKRSCEYAPYVNARNAARKNTGTSLRSPRQSSCGTNSALTSSAR